MLPLGSVLSTTAPGQWAVSRTPDAKSAVIATFATASDAEAAWDQLERWCSALHSEVGSGLAVPVPLRLPDAVPRLAYPEVPWRVGADGLSAVASAAQAVTVLRGLAATLDRLHARGMFHGALGLASLWWDSAEQVRLPDAGLAHVLDGVVDPSPVAAAYHAPEIWRGSAVLPASDQYALAIIAVELLSGRTRSAVSNVEGLVAFEPVVLDPHAEMFQGIARGLYDVLQRAMSASPSARFPSCTAFVEALDGHVAPVQSLRTVHPPISRIRRHITARGTGFTIAAVAAIVAAFLVARQPERGSDVASSVSEKIRDANVGVMILPGQRSRDFGVGTPTIRREGASGQREQGARGQSDERRVEPSSANTRVATPSAEQSTSNDASVLNSRSAGSGRFAAGEPAARSTARAIDSVVASNSLGNRVTTAMNSAIRSVTGTGTRPLTESQAAASAEIARSGVIRLDVPRGSRVYLDGVLLGETPSTITTSSGPHDVDVLLPGDQVAQRRRIIVVAADTTVLRVARND